MSGYFTDSDRARAAFLLGRLTAHAEAMLDEHGGDCHQRAVDDLDALRLLLLPETGRPRDPDRLGLGPDPRD